MVYGHSHEYESCEAYLSGRPHLHCGDEHHHDEEDMNTSTVMKRIMIMPVLGLI